MHVLSLIAADGDSSGGGAAIVQLGIFLLIPIAMYFLLIRPQRRRQRSQAAMQSSIDVGDEVMTTSGLYGFITGFDGNIVWLEIDDNVQIRVARAAVQRKVDTAAGQIGDAPSHDEAKRNTQIEPAADTGDTAEQ
ncbi:MAG: preprotein translocase subunit YajC [Actinobacteria bacterium]|nr:preprotein translocase subunit YajC [Actinomycetota bacterium]